MAKKKTPARRAVEREKVAFRLPKDVTAKLRETSARLDISQAMIVAVLVRKHADALQMRVE